MAFGFSSKQTQTVSLSNLTPIQFIAIAKRACEKLK